MFCLIFAIALVTAPVAYAVTVAIDFGARGRLALTPTLAWIHVYILAEMVGIVVCAYLWGRRGTMSRERWLRSHHTFQRWWMTVQFQAARRLFGFRLVVEGKEALIGGPYLLLSRHASILDNMIPPAITADRKMHLRWVVNRRLLMQPSVDIVGHRLPNVFVGGRASQPLADVASIRSLADELGPNDAVVLYPEGTLFSPGKREETIQRLRRKGESVRLAAAERMKHVLLPEPAGTLSLLRAAKGVDVVFCTHNGLEDALDRPAIARGGLVGRTVRVKCWRVPAEDVPQARDAMLRWLLDQWACVDLGAAPVRNV
jgi:1-acyl-sn-glycerol-3-phosphate acyltransferase